MKLYNLKDHNEQVSFAQAVTQGLGKHQGLFFPHDLPEFSLTEIDEMLQQDFMSRSAKILSAFIGDEIPQGVLQERIGNAFTFPAPVSKVQDDVGCLELFHGPTLAFKDFGGRFMAQMLTHIAGDKPVTILTATSGDTGAAVAHAFYGLPNVKVVILYPRGKISPLQEKLFCTLGGNIETVAIDGDFDACQALVKQAFDDEELKAALGLNSANSINISRLLAQICYYFEAVAQLPQEARNQLVISVPSGNFGDLTAGLLAKSLGLPIKRFIAATNANDTVPRFLQDGNWSPKATQATLVFGGLYEALVVLAGYLVINLVFGNILEPRIMGRGLGLSTLVVFLSLIFWGWLLGPVGKLLSVPLTIIVKIALEQTVAGQSIAFLLSDLSKN